MDKLFFATAQDHYRRFNIFKSSRDYAITVSSKNGNRNITIVNAKQYLWQSAPIGEEILGLEYNEKYLFGQEMDVEFGLINE